jgi:membrane protease YdiL (CAAX protease family)
MTTFSQRLCHIFGMGKPYPSHPLVWIIAACIALLELPASAVIHHVNLGLGVVLNEIVFILGIPLLVVHAMRFNGKKLFPFKLPKARSLVPLLIAIAGMVIVIDYLTWTSEYIWPLPERYQTALENIMSVTSPLDFAYKLMLLSFIPGICEEVFFRGFVQTSLAHANGKWFGILIASALFALLHGNPWYFHLYFLLGLFLSWTYSVSATLIVPIACHILNNAWTFTNHTLGTTLPWEHEPLALNLIIFSAGIVLLATGCWLFRYTSRTQRR